MSDVVDLHIGKRLRWRRKMLGLTQAKLGSMCGLTFQQIQKFESAATHLSVATLWRLADALGVDPQYFYEGLERESPAAGVVSRRPGEPPAFGGARKS